MGKNYWMIVIRSENFQKTREKGFKIQGMKSSERKRAQRMQPDDRLLYYIEDTQKFGATATVRSSCFEDHEPIWISPNGGEQFPYRVQIEPNYILEDDEHIDARQISPRLDYVKKWIPEKWPLAFHGNLHLLPKKDFNLIEMEMKKLLRARRKDKKGDERTQNDAGNETQQTSTSLGGG